MFVSIKNYISTATLKRRTAAIVVVSSGFLFPLILLIFSINIHGAFANVVDFGPLRYAFMALLGLSILVALAAILDIIVQSRRAAKKPEFPFVTTWILASLSITIIVALSGFITFPRLIRTGDTNPQLMLTENPSGAPGIAVAFHTQYKTINTLQWGQGGNLDKTIREPGPLNHHWIQIPGLEYEKLYNYRLNGAAATGFRTPPAAGKALHFAASGDPHFGNPLSDNDVTRKLLDYVKAPGNDFSMFFVLGDTAQLGFMDSLWKQAFSAISTCSSSIPASYIIGNHDTLFGGLELYQDYLCPPAAGDQKGDCLYKHIDINNVHFLLLDVEWDARAFTPEEEKWLIKQLESIPRTDWCVVMSHTFYYCSGLYQDGWAWYDNEDTIARLMPIFEKYGVDMVLSGHKHQTEVLQKNGVNYVVVGSMGGPLDPERTYISPASLWYKAGQFGIADVTIKGSSADLVIRGPDGAEVFKTVINKR